MNVVQLGPLLLNFNLLLFILSAFVAFVIIKMRLHLLNKEGMIAEKFARAIIIGFFTWKFSLILFDPVSVIQQPMSLIYFDGGDKGIGLAFVASLVYVWIRTRKDHTPLSLNLDLASAGWVAGSSVYQLLLMTMDTSNMLFHILYMILNGILAICLFSRMHTTTGMEKMSPCWMWYSLGMAGIFFFKENRAFMISGFTKEQVVYFIIFLLALGFSSRFNQKMNKEAQ